MLSPVSARLQMALMSRTLMNSYNDIAGFLISFFIIFVVRRPRRTPRHSTSIHRDHGALTRCAGRRRLQGCGQTFMMVFGPHMPQYSTLSQSMLSLFRAILGQFELVGNDEQQGMLEVSPVAGPIFCVFIVMVDLILIFMLIGFLNHGYILAKVSIYGDGCAASCRRRRRPHLSA